MGGGITVHFYNKKGRKTAMREIMGKHFRFVEVSENIYAAIAPAQGLNIIDAGLILRGVGLICDTCFDLPHA